MSEDREAFLSARRAGLGGSDMAAVMGCDPYRRPLDVYLDKVGLGDDATGPHIQRGIALEPIVRELYKVQEQREVSELRDGRMLQRAEAPWALGHPDGFIENDKELGRGILEIKCPSLSVYQNTRLHGIPGNYQIQMQHYLWLSGLKWGEFAIFSAERWQLFVTRVERDEVLIEHIKRYGAKFWNEHILTDTPPRKHTTPPVELPATSGEVVLLEGREAGWLADLAEAKAMQKEANDLVAGCSDRIATRLALGVYEAGGHRLYLSQQQGRKTLDRKALQADHPELDLSRYEAQGKPFNTLRVYDVKQ